MTPLPEPPPPAGQLSEAWAEKMRAAYQASLNENQHRAAHLEAARAAWEASPGPELAEALEGVVNYIPLYLTGSPEDFLLVREIARLALSSLGGSER